MTKERLIEFGLDEATAEKIAEASKEEMKGFIPKSRFNEVNAAKKELENQVAKRDKQCEALKQSVGDSKALKAKIMHLQEAVKDTKAEYEAKVKQLQIDHAVNTALAGAKAKNLKAARALLDLEKAELEGETVKGLSAQIKRLRGDEDTKFLFEASVPGKTKCKGVITQKFKLFISPEISILPGSKITVTQNGRPTGYQPSGQSKLGKGINEILGGSVQC